MKIALVRKEYLDTHGGAERYAVGLARGLATRGHEVHVLAGTYQPETTPGITLHRIPFSRRPSALKNISFQRNVFRFQQEHRFDIVNGLSQIFPQDVYRLGDGLHLHWLRVQTPNPRKRFFKYFSPRHMVILQIERRIFKDGNLRRVIANSQMCKNQLMQYYGVAEEMITVVRNGVDQERFNRKNVCSQRGTQRRRFGFDEADTVLLFVGHNYKRKGLQFVLQCAAGLKQQGHRVKVLVVGRGDQSPFMKLAVRLNIAGDVVFAGPVENITEAYAAADLLVHPALYDPFSNVCLEAMACGLPVVTTRLNGASEVVEPGAGGIVVDYPWEVSTMVEGIAGMLGSDRQSLQEAGLKASGAAAGCTLENNIDATVAVYRAVLREKGATA